MTASAPSCHRGFLQRSPARRPLHQTILVKAEFVYNCAASVSPTRVTLHGDWDHFSPHLLEKEEERVWSAIVMVPTGYHEFYYQVDGVIRLNPGHAVVEGQHRNWRFIHDVQRDDRVRGEHMFIKWMDEKLESYGIVVADDDDFGDLPLVVGDLQHGKDEWVSPWTVVAVAIVAVLILRLGVEFMMA